MHNNVDDSIRWTYIISVALLFLLQRYVYFITCIEFDNTKTDS